MTQAQTTDRTAIGGNNPPHLASLAEARYFVERCASLHVKDAATAEEAARLIDEEVKARKAADRAREIEKAPYLEQGREVDANWKPVIATYQEGGAIVKQRALAYAQAERARQAAEAEAARLEAERIQEEAMAALAAKQAPEADPWDSIAAEIAVEKADAAMDRATTLESQVAAPAQIRADGIRARGVKVVWSAEVIDPKALVIALAGNSAVQAEAIKIANAMARAMKDGFELAGCKAKATETL